MVAVGGCWLVVLLESSTVKSKIETALSRIESSPDSVASALLAVRLVGWLVGLWDSLQTTEAELKRKVSTLGSGLQSLPTCNRVDTVRSSSRRRYGWGGSRSSMDSPDSKPVASLQVSPVSAATVEKLAELRKQIEEHNSELSACQTYFDSFGKACERILKNKPRNQFHRVALSLLTAALYGSEKWNGSKNRFDTVGGCINGEVWSVVSEFRKKDVLTWSVVSRKRFRFEPVVRGKLKRNPEQRGKAGGRVSVKEGQELWSELACYWKEEHKDRYERKRENLKSAILDNVTHYATELRRQEEEIRKLKAVREATLNCAEQHVRNTFPEWCEPVVRVAVAEYTAAKKRELSPPIEDREKWLERYKIRNPSGVEFRKWFDLVERLQIRLSNFSSSRGSTVEAFRTYWRGLHHSGTGKLELPTEEQIRELEVLKRWVETQSALCSQSNGMILTTPEPVGTVELERGELSSVVVPVVCWLWLDYDGQLYREYSVAKSGLSAVDAKFVASVSSYHANEATSKEEAFEILRQRLASGWRFAANQAATVEERRKRERNRTATAAKFLRGLEVVSVQDSFQVGNCVPGTRSFLQRIGLPATTETISGRELVKAWKSSKWLQEELFFRVVDNLKKRTAATVAEVVR